MYIYICYNKILGEKYKHVQKKVTCSSNIITDASHVSLCLSIQVVALSCHHITLELVTILFFPLSTVQYSP